MQFIGFRLHSNKFASFSKALANIQTNITFAIMDKCERPELCPARGVQLLLESGIFNTYAQHWSKQKSDDRRTKSNVWKEAMTLSSLQIIVWFVRSDARGGLELVVGSSRHDTVSTYTMTVIN